MPMKRGLERSSVEREAFSRGRTGAANTAGWGKTKDISRDAALQQRRGASSQAVKRKRPDGTDINFDREAALQSISGCRNILSFPIFLDRSRWRDSP